MSGCGTGRPAPLVLQGQGAGLGRQLPAAVHLSLHSMLVHLVCFLLWVLEPAIMCETMALGGLVMGARVL